MLPRVVLADPARRNVGRVVTGCVLALSLHGLAFAVGRIFDALKDWSRAGGPAHAFMIRMSDDTAPPERPEPPERPRLEPLPDPVVPDIRESPQPEALT